jgi:hypothetical protein
MAYGYIDDRNWYLGMCPGLRKEYGGWDSSSYQYYSGRGRFVFRDLDAYKCGILFLYILDYDKPKTDNTFISGNDQAYLALGRGEGKHHCFSRHGLFIVHRGQGFSIMRDGCLCLCSGSNRQQNSRESGSLGHENIYQVTSVPGILRGP